MDCGSFRVNAAVAVLLALSVPAFSSPIVGVGNNQPQTWQQGIANGNVAPTTKPLTTAAQKFYAQQAQGKNVTIQQVVPVLTPKTITVNGRTRTVLVNSFQVVQKTITVAGTSYNYRADPDLTNFTINDEALSPTGISSLGVELVDTNGDAAGWFTDAPELDNFDTYHLNLSDQKTQGQFDFFYEDPGFSLTDVIELRMEQGSIYGATFTTPDPAGYGGAWDAWSSLQAVPEPAPLSALVAGLLGTGLAARRRTRK